MTTQNKLIIPVTITSSSPCRSKISGAECVRLELNPNLKHWPSNITTFVMLNTLKQDQLEKSINKVINQESLEDLEGLKILVELGLEDYQGKNYLRVHYFHPPID